MFFRMYMGRSVWTPNRVLPISMWGCGVAPMAMGGIPPESHFIFLADI
jgi:hypothetical protein